MRTGYTVAQGQHLHEAESVCTGMPLRVYDTATYVPESRVNVDMDGRLENVCLVQGLPKTSQMVVDRRFVLLRWCRLVV